MFYVWWFEEMVKYKGLGKGLDALLSASKISLQDDKNSKQNVGLTTLSIDVLQAGKYQPRQIFEEDNLQELADSIKANGIIQPIIVRAISNTNYEIIAGERRFRAAKMAGLLDVPVVVRDFNDEEALAVSLIENIQRKDLNIVEEALGYRRLIDEFGLTHEALAQVTGKSRSNVSNTLRLLNLCSYVLELLMERKIDMGHARAMLPLSEDKQILLANEVLLKKYTTAEVENKVAKILHEQQFGAEVKLNKANKDQDISSFESLIAERIGMMVAIKHNRSGHGKITVDYSNVDELEAFIARIK
jgi:ParB family chromosome partitioning protein